MKILVLVRQVPDGEARLRIVGDAVDLSDAAMIVDGMDEYGIEEALRLREAGQEVEVISLGIGPKEEALRSSLAMGADRAIHLETSTVLDAVALSKVVSQIALEEGATLVLVGGQQADWDSQALGAAVAERLGWVQLTWTNALTLTGQTLTGRHDTDEGNESFETELPAVVTAQQGLNEPRYITLPNIMKAKKKELRKESLERFNVVPKVIRLRSEIQSRARLGKILEGKDPVAAAHQLLELLREDAKVIA